MTTGMKIVSAVRQLAIIFLISLAGDRAVQIWHLPVPGSVVGMLLLFVLLSCGVVKTAQLQEVTSFLLKHMSFFFVPVTVGLMSYWGIFYQSGWLLLSLLAVSLLVAFLIFRLAAFMNERRG